jgi:hypothetical protein
MKIKIWCLLIAVILCAACEKESIFTGSDAHIISFSLTANGVKYPAAITEEEIIISVPSDVNLNNAQVKYELCENASIMPLPEEISNWNEEHTFRIQAHNSAIFNQYIYTVRVNDLVEDGNVLLQTQSQVNDFAAKKINKIEGNLIIGTASKDTQDPVKDLTALSYLKEVGLNIVINNGFAGNTLEGLHNIEKAGGLYIGTDNVKTSTVQKISVDMPLLSHTTNIVVYCDSVKSLELPALKRASRLHINSIQLEKLDLSSLETVEGEFTLKGNKGGSSVTDSNNILLSINLPKLKNVIGPFTLENLWAVRDFEIPALETVNGALDIKYVRTVKNITLPVLKTVSGAVNIEANDGMSSLSLPLLKSAASVNIASYNNFSINLLKINMEKIENIDGAFTVKYYAGKSLSLPLLKTIGGAMTLNTLQFLETLNTPLLKSCGGIILQQCSSLKTCNMSGVEETGTLTVTACPAIEFYSPQKVTGNATIGGALGSIISGPIEIGGTLSVTPTNEIFSIPMTQKVGTFNHTSGATLVEFSMPDLEEAGNINISSLNVVTKYSMPRLNKVNGNLSIKGLYLAKDLDMSSLTTITGTFTFYGGTSKSYASRSTITNLNTFSALTSAKNVDIRYAGALVDYSGLKNVIPSLSSASSWKVQDCAYNPTYQDMIDGKFTNN